VFPIYFSSPLNWCDCNPIVFFRTKICSLISSVFGIIVDFLIAFVFFFQRPAYSSIISLQFCGTDVYRHFLALAVLYFLIDNCSVLLFYAIFRGFKDFSLGTCMAVVFIVLEFSYQIMVAWHFLCSWRRMRYNGGDVIV
jgi:hypothetical protein